MTIAQLRVEPADALTRFIYAFTNPKLAEASSGIVDQSDTKFAMHTLAYRAGGSPGIDYYFPYARVPLGISVENPADGAIAITPPMNGCALQVNSSGGRMIFYHDPDGNRMAQAQPAVSGTKVCRITSEAYWDAGWAASVAATMRLPGYQFICVHRGGVWHVGAFRFGTNASGSVVSGGSASGPSVSSSYLGSFSATETLLLEG